MRTPDEFRKRRGPVGPRNARLQTALLTAGFAGALGLLGPVGLPADAPDESTARPAGQTDDQAGAPAQSPEPVATVNLENYDGPDGQAVVVLKRLEKSGVFSLSVRGIFEIAGFNPGEDCDEATGECYEPRVKTVEFELEDETPQLIKFLEANPGKQMFVRYNLPLFGEKWQLVDARVWAQHPPPGTPPALRVPPSGSRRDFVVRGRVLRLEKAGSVQRIWEGLYFDLEKRRVYPVSVTNERMAACLALAMAARETYHLGIAVAYFPGFRKSTHDIYEINYVSRPTPP